MGNLVPARLRPRSRYEQQPCVPVVFAMPNGEKWEYLLTRREFDELELDLEAEYERHYHPRVLAAGGREALDKAN